MRVCCKTYAGTSKPSRTPVLLPFVLARCLWTNPHLDKMGSRHVSSLFGLLVTALGGANAVGPPDAIRTLKIKRFN